MVDDVGLVDLGFSGARFTWSRGLSSENFKGAHIDRALCSMEWQLQFSTATVTHLPKLNSDHCPLLVNLLDSPPAASAGRSFRFQLAWFAHHNFKDWFPQNWDRGKMILVLNFQCLQRELPHGVERCLEISTKRSVDYGLG